MKEKNEQDQEINYKLRIVINFILIAILMFFTISIIMPVIKTNKSHECPTWDNLPGRNSTFEDYDNMVISGIRLVSAMHDFEGIPIVILINTTKLSDANVSDIEINGEGYLNYNMLIDTSSLLKWTEVAGKKELRLEGDLESNVQYSKRSIDAVMDKENVEYIATITDKFECYLIKNAAGDIKGIIAREIR